MSYKTDLIDCDEKDKVYVYNARENTEFLTINEDMIGVVESITQKMDEDWTGMTYLSYRVEIRLKNGKLIKIKDEKAQTLFRKYEFITIKDLNKYHKLEIQ